MQPNGDDPQHYILPPQNKGVIAPMHDDNSPVALSPADNTAAEVIRQKIAGLYAEEPSAQTELAEAESTGSFRSPHQAFMHQLANSGKSLAQIQTEWHN